MRERSDPRTRPGDARAQGRGSGRAALSRDGRYRSRSTSRCRGGRDVASRDIPGRWRRRARRDRRARARIGWRPTELRPPVLSLGRRRHHAERARRGLAYVDLGPKRVRMGLHATGHALRRDRGRVAQGSVRAARVVGRRAHDRATMANFTRARCRAALVGQRHDVDVDARGLAGLAAVPVLSSGYIHPSATKALAMLGIGRDTCGGSRATMSAAWISRHWRMRCVHSAVRPRSSWGTRVR